ncbi:AraC family ligand binding domain-containing protein [Pseudonocardia asaccharolytica]|uniref:Homogentisate 1,2-dioxygenase n=1 Tax=Pseudonocardia asaccharolytica DSM 44247 = NBRC 16224 TaxID=1123024 RepID=A0A511D746_9PSEU|nr:AraC family ligand binding domain-containing protein [Pseudonocardia asaccharolytica]GEL20631.1 homogentisate 1,2-dioxygenase [Pseudonocardia asaccharolytica DSM 44247 = NBRC 16224]
MSAPTDGPGPGKPPNIDLYTRNGFAGPMATIARAQYSPPYTRVQGSYAPRRFDVYDVADAAFAESRALPVAVLKGAGVTVEVARRSEPTAFAVRNVLADELHYVLEGAGELHTDFGVLQVRAGDFVLLPRAVTYRYARIDSPLREMIVVTDSQLAVDPENAPGVLNVELHVDAPVPDPSIDRGPGEYEIIIRHGREFTSYFYDYDPLPSLAVLGAPIVRRFNIENVHGLGVEKGGLMPPRLINDTTTRTMVYYLGNRRSDRPPIHHNADYDEVIFYVAGPGHYGAVDKPGTVTWTPKGIIHQGPEEDVPEGYEAWLLETRAPLSLTPAGREIGRLMETGQFDIHPSVGQPA